MSTPTPEISEHSAANLQIRPLSHLTSVRFKAATDGIGEFQAEKGARSIDLPAREPL